MSFGRHTAQSSPCSGRSQVAIDQAHAYPLTRMRLLPGMVRYMYERSRDSKVNHEPGQDFLTFRYAGSRLAFAVCDGVSGSFLGHLAARFLGEHLVTWLWEQPSPISTDGLRRELPRYLVELVGPAGHFIETYPLPNDLPPLVRDILEERRAYGSEAMFVCGRIDWPSPNSPGQVALAGLGDAELQVYDKHGGRRVSRGNVVERWSTSRGPRGNLQVLVEPADGIARIIAYSDGLRNLADDLHHLADNLLDQELVRLGQHPHSDDLALVDIALEERYMPAERGAADYRQSPRPPRDRQRDQTAHTPPAEVAPSPEASLAPPRIVSADRDRAGGVLLCWTPVHGMQEYRVQLAATPTDFEHMPLEYAVRETTFRTALLTAQFQYARVRAIAGEQGGCWSEIVPLGSTHAGRPVEPTSQRPVSHTPPRYRPETAEPSPSQPLPSPRFLAPPSNAVINTAFRLTWTEVAGAECYVIQEATEATFDPDDVLDEKVYGLVWKNVVTEPGVYYYRVQAQTGNVRSAWSDPLCVQIHSAETGHTA
jgi:hypothetical protein